MIDAAIAAVHQYPETTGKRIAQKFFLWYEVINTQVYVAEHVVKLAKLIDEENECGRGQKRCALVKAPV